MRLEPTNNRKVIQDAEHYTLDELNGQRSTVVEGTAIPDSMALMLAMAADYKPTTIISTGKIVVSEQDKRDKTYIEDAFTNLQLLANKKTTSRILIKSLASKLLTHLSGWK